MLQPVKDYINSITIEPVILIYIFGVSTLDGAQVPTNLLIWKLCTKDLNYTEEICGNLSAEANEDVENEVQRKLANFEMISKWIRTTPTLVYAFVMGALSDKFGRKPLLMLPMIGTVIDGILQLINYQFIEVLPTEFFFAISVSAFLGGVPMYYLGFYAFGANVSTEKERAARLARIDGVECFGILVGVLASPLIFNRFGYFGSFGISVAFTFTGLLYLIVFIKEVVEPQPFGKFSMSPIELLKTLFSPVKELFQSILKKRPQGLRNLIFLQILVYATYWFILEGFSIYYMYFLKILPEFNGEDYSHVTVFRNVRDMIATLVMMPILSTKLQINEGLLICIAAATETAGFLMTPFITKVWHIYFTEGVMLLGFVKYASARAMISKCIDPDEVGKIFSGFSILSAFVPFISNPVYRNLYGRYVDTFPGAPFLVSAAAMLVASIVNFYLYTQRHRMRSHQVDDSSSLSKNDSSSNAHPETTSTSL